MALPKQNKTPPNQKYTAADFIVAIPNSAAVKSLICRRVGCARHTFNDALEKYATVRQAFEEEKAKGLDLAESVVFGNIQAAAALQEVSGYRVIVDSTDARWLLSQKGQDRGYGNSAVIQGPDGGAVEIVVRYDSSTAHSVAKANAANDDMPVVPALGQNGSNGSGD